MSRDRATASNMLERGVHLLQAIRVEDGGTVSLSTLVARTGLPKPTAYRLAQNLTELGLLERQAVGYSLGVGLLELSELVPVRRRLRETALPFMQDLYEVTHETVHLGIRDGLDVIYAEKIRGHRGVEVPTRVGGRLPLTSTGLGKVLLAFAGADVEAEIAGRPFRRLTSKSVTQVNQLRRQLATIRSTRIARESEEAALGVACFACPVTVGDEVVAGISVTFDSKRRERSGLEAALRTVSAAVSRSLG